jgi:hypothetical protein
METIFMLVGGWAYIYQQTMAVLGKTYQLIL